MPPAVTSTIGRSALELNDVMRQAGHGVTKDVHATTVLVICNEHAPPHTHSQAHRHTGTQAQPGTQEVRSVHLRTDVGGGCDETDACTHCVAYATRTLQVYSTLRSVHHGQCWHVFIKKLPAGC